MKILVLSYPFYEYGEIIAKAFHNIGCDTNYISYGYPNEGIKNIIKYSIPRRIGFDVERRLRSNFSIRVSKNIKLFKPDFILLIRGDFLSDNLINAIKLATPSPKIIVWTMDGIDKLDRLMIYRKEICHWFVFEPTDVCRLKHFYNISAEFLPLAFDPDYYHPNSKGSSANLTDLSFIGSIKDKNRLTELDKLSKWSLDKKLDFKIISGNYRPRNFYIIYPYRYLWKCLYKRHMRHSEVNALYNNCMININIHKNQSIEGMNMRFFEIMGSGGLQIVEEKKSQKIIGFEPGKDFLTYSSHEDMLKKIKYVLDNPEKGREIARNGFNKSTKHTFECRARTILAHLLK